MKSHTERDRARERDLDRPGVVGHGGQEGPQTDVGVRGEEGVEQRSIGIDVALLEHQGAVGRDLDAGDARRGLGDHALAPGSGRERRGEGHAGRVAQRELDGLTRVAMRKAADTRREAHRQRNYPLICHVDTPRRSSATRLLLPLNSDKHVA